MTHSAMSVQPVLPSWKSAPRVTSQESRDTHTSLVRAHEVNGAATGMLRAVPALSLAIAACAPDAAGERLNDLLGPSDCLRLAAADLGDVRSIVRAILGGAVAALELRSAGAEVVGGVAAAVTDPATGAVECVAGAGGGAAYQSVVRTSGRSRAAGALS